MKLGYAAFMWERRGGYKVFMGKSEGNRPLGRPGRGWRDNIRIYLKEKKIGSELSWTEMV
jgi:hypothetical protein